MANNLLIEAALRGDLIYIQNNLENLDKKTTKIILPHLLISAIKGGHLDILMWMAGNTNINMSRRLSDNTTYLHCAAYFGQLAILQWLIDNTLLTLRDKDEKGALPLHYAASAGHLELIQWLLNNTKSEISEMDNEGLSIIDYAYIKGQPHILQWCLENNPLHFKNPDHFSPGRAHPRTMKWLIGNNYLSLTKKDAKGLTVLHHAAKAGNLDLVQFLFSLNPPEESLLGEDGAPVLFYAVQSDNTKMLDWFWENRKSDFALKDESNKSAIHYSGSCGSLKSLKWLAPKPEFDLNEEAEECGMTVLHYAAEMDQLPVVQWLVEQMKMSDVVCNDFRTTPLQLAARSESLEVVKWLLKYNPASIDLRDWEDKNAARHALEVGNIELYQYLVTFNPKNDPKEEAKTSLYCAIQHQQLEAIQFLVETHGLDVNEPFSEGMTPIELALTITNESEFQDDYRIQYNPDVLVYLYAQVCRQNGSNRSLQINNERIASIQQELPAQACLYSQRFKHLVQLGLIEHVTLIIMDYDEDNRYLIFFNLLQLEYIRLLIKIENMTTLNANDAIGDNKLTRQKNYMIRQHTHLRLLDDILLPTSEPAESKTSTAIAPINCSIPLQNTKRQRPMQGFFENPTPPVEVEEKTGAEHNKRVKMEP